MSSPGMGAWQAAKAAATAPGLVDGAAALPRLR